jgi:hypothetical protein
MRNSACHPERAGVAQRRISAFRTNRRGCCDPTIARLDRLRFELTQKGEDPHVSRS